MNLLTINQFSDILITAGFGILVVFCALVLLVFAFSTFEKLTRYNAKRKKIKSNPSGNSIQIDSTVKDDELSSNEVAAIATALHLFFSDVHDEESNIITIKRIERRYSPWNSKIYGITNLHQ